MLFVLQAACSPEILLTQQQPYVVPTVCKRNPFVSVHVYRYTVRISTYIERI